ncbi:hypothetical protein WMY93_029119 [Mugilogobius chulae]|uniref:Uncharacterized protein n=1 Tax=Mugilogobius chulae TaxID=88201 RepID=A0AAW0MS54_9GOBI
MCDQTLRSLVNARLTAAAEDIFALFERTLAEYEEELCRSKQENQRKQVLLDSLLSHRVVLTTADVQITSLTPGLGLDQETPETPQIKEEPQEQLKEDQLQVSEYSDVCVKMKNLKTFNNQQTEYKNETQGEDINSNHTETEEDTWHSYTHNSEACGTHSVVPLSKTFSLNQTTVAFQTTKSRQEQPKRRNTNAPCVRRDFTLTRMYKGT